MLSINTKRINWISAALCLSPNFGGEHLFPICPGAFSQILGALVFQPISVLLASVCSIQRMMTVLLLRGERSSGEKVVLCDGLR